MQDYELDIRHVRGRDNVIADAISRIPSSREASRPLWEGDVTVVSH